MPCSCKCLQCSRAGAQHRQSMHDIQSRPGPRQIHQKLTSLCKLAEICRMQWKARVTTVSQFHWFSVPAGHVKCVCPLPKNPRFTSLILCHWMLSHYLDSDIGIEIPVLMTRILYTINLVHLCKALTRATGAAIDTGSCNRLSSEHDLENL